MTGGEASKKGGKGAFLDFILIHIRERVLDKGISAQPQKTFLLAVPLSIISTSSDRGIQRKVYNSWVRRCGVFASFFSKDRKRVVGYKYRKKSREVS